MSICFTFKIFSLILTSNFLVSFISFLISLILIPFGESPSTDFIPFLFSSGFKTSKASACFFPCSQIVFVCFSKAFPKGEYAN